MLQWLIVAPIVGFAFCTAAWSLMPASARKWLATVLLARSLPAFLSNALRPYAAVTGACACSGCDRPAIPGPAHSAAMPITIHRRRPRRAGQTLAS